MPQSGQKKECIHTYFSLSDEPFDQIGFGKSTLGVLRTINLPFFYHILFENVVK